MKEHVEPKTDPILEECYRIKAEFAAQFNSITQVATNNFCPFQHSFPDAFPTPEGWYVYRKLCVQPLALQRSAMSEIGGNLRFYRGTL